MSQVGPSLLLDENLSHRLLSRLADWFPGSRHAREVAVVGAPDLDLWRLAAAAGMVLVTKDDDFRQLSFLRDAPPKVVWLVVGNAGTAEIAALLIGKRAVIADFVADPALALLVLRPLPPV